MAATRRPRASRHGFQDTERFEPPTPAWHANGGGDPRRPSSSQSSCVWEHSLWRLEGGRHVTRTACHFGSESSVAIDGHAQRDGGTRFYPIDSAPPHELCRRSGESASSPLTPGDDRPGGEGRWTSRVIARPEHRLSDDLHAGEPRRAWRGGGTRWVYGCAELLRWRRATQRLSRCVISPLP